MDFTDTSPNHVKTIYKVLRTPHSSTSSVVLLLTPLLLLLLGMCGNTLHVTMRSRYRTCDDQFTGMLVVGREGLNCDVERLLAGNLTLKTRYPELLERVVRVRDEFSKEDVPVRVQAVDHDFAKSSDVGL